jgi:hypothetical protein
MLESQAYDWVACFKTFKDAGVTTRAYLEATSLSGNRLEGMQTHGVNHLQHSAMLQSAIKLKIAFNALPGTFDDHMWAHQYDQQANQGQVGSQSNPWTTDGPKHIDMGSSLTSAAVRQTSIRAGLSFPPAYGCNRRMVGWSRAYMGYAK